MFWSGIAEGFQGWVGCQESITRQAWKGRFELPAGSEGSACLRFNPAPNSPSLLLHPCTPLHPPPQLANPETEWTSLWAYAWGLGTRRPPSNNSLHPLGIVHQLLLLVCPVFPLPVSATALAASLPAAPALSLPPTQLPAPPVPASLAYLAPPAPALPALPVLP